VSQWNAHPLAGERREQLVLGLHDRVVSTVDLPGVPAGTGGKVILANGFVWRRYRIRFDNGEELAHLDGRHLEPAKRKGLFSK
jgi:hypothetical protein